MAYFNGKCVNANMEIEKIKKIIIGQKEEIEEIYRREKIIKREIDFARLRKFLASPNILLITGPRRSGKSTLATLLLKDKKSGYLNFDDERLAGFCANDFDTTLQAFYELYGQDIEYFIFDEIQNISGWELFANRLRRTKKIIITGSNANMLSGELATHLTGRYLEFVLYPFSFREFLAFKSVEIKENDFYSTKKISQIKKYLDEYLKRGGFPETYKFGAAIASKTYEDIIAKDILLRYGVKNKQTFREMANYVISNFSGDLNYRKLGHIFSIKNVHTVKNYIDYLSSVFLIFIFEKFSYKLKQRYITSKKVYGIDTGMVNSVAVNFSDNLGRIMENAVAIDLKRRKSYWQNNLEIFYWSDYAGKEVDFALKEQKKITQLIQVCRNLGNLKTKERETRALVRASEELKCDNLLIITDDEEGQEDFNGKKIAKISLWKWLLADYKK